MYTNDDDSVMKKLVEKPLQDSVAAKLSKDLSDLKGQIKFSDGYDYKSLRAGR